MNIIRISDDFSFMGSGQYPKVFRTKGCGCCSDDIRITEESINQVIQEAENWLKILRTLEPEIYPEEE